MSRSTVWLRLQVPNLFDEPSLTLLDEVIKSHVGVAVLSHDLIMVIVPLLTSDSRNKYLTVMLFARGA